MKFAIVPMRNILIHGVTITPNDQVATIETDLPVRDVLALLQFRNAQLIQIDQATSTTASEPPALAAVDQEPIDKPASKKTARHRA